MPSNYEEYDLGTKKGLLRFAQTASEILTEGGSETHTHSYDTYRFASGVWGGSYVSPVGDANHMPPYIAVKLVRRVS